MSSETDNRSNFGMSNTAKYSMFGGIFLIIIIMIVVFIMMRRKKKGGVPASAFGRRWR